MTKRVKIIHNRTIEVTPKNIYNSIILLSIVIFILGFMIGYFTSQQIYYEKIINVINNQGLLIVDEKYYRIIEVFL